MFTSSRGLFSPSLSPSPSPQAPPQDMPSAAHSPGPSLGARSSSASSESSARSSGYRSDGEDGPDVLLSPKRRRMDSLFGSEAGSVEPRGMTPPWAAAQTPTSAGAEPQAPAQVAPLEAAVAALLGQDATGPWQQALAQEQVLKLQGRALQTPLMQVPLPVLRALVTGIPRVAEVQFDGVPDALAAFERLVFAGLPLEQLTHLRFIDCAIDSARLQRFMAHTPRLTGLRHLTLPDVAERQTAGHKRAWGETVRQVLQLLPSSEPVETSPTAAAGDVQFFSSLHHLIQLDSFDWSAAGHSAMLLDMQHNQQLSQLVLRGEWDRFIVRGGLPNSQLERLQLHDCQLTSASAAQLAAAPFARSLSHLDVSANPRLQSIDLTHFTGLISLNVRGSLAGNGLMLPQAEAPDGAQAESPALERLQLGYTPLRGRLARVDLGQLPALVELNLEGCGLTAQDLSSWQLPAQNKLETLVLDDNPLGSEGMAALTGLPLPNLTHLDLRRVQLDHTGAVALARGGGLRARWPHLERMRLGQMPSGAALHTLQAISELPGGQSLAEFS